MLIININKPTESHQPSSSAGHGGGSIFFACRAVILAKNWPGDEARPRYETTRVQQ